jgi:ectoine hydroxylase-related dioxygenase (phytanoyl-CoA dioxygenase family)
MGSKLSPAERLRYEHDGFVFPFTVLDPAEVATCKQALEQLQSPLAAVGVKPPHSQFHLHFRWAYELVTHPTILDLVEDVIGPDILVHSSTIFAKPPHHPGFISWHQDTYNWKLDKPRLLSVWVALTSSTSESGCMRAIPGSHRQQLPHAVRLHPDNMLVSSHLNVELEINEAEAVDFVLQPGQISLHHGDVIHGSNANNSDGWRIGLTIRYIASDVRQTTPHHEVVLARGRDLHCHYKRLEQAPSTDVESGIAAHAAFQARRHAIRSGLETSY